MLNSDSMHVDGPAQNVCGFNVTSKLVTSAEADSLITFGFQMLSPKSDFSGSDEVAAVAKVFRDKRAAVLARKKAYVYQVPPRLDAPQMLLD